MGQKMIRRKQEVKEKSRIEKRVSVIDTPDLIKWADQALFGIGRGLTDWGRTDEYLALEEAKIGAESLLAVLEELARRSENKRNF